MSTTEPKYLTDLRAKLLPSESVLLHKKDVDGRTIIVTEQRLIILYSSGDVMHTFTCVPNSKIDSIEVADANHPGYSVVKIKTTKSDFQFGIQMSPTELYEFVADWQTRFFATEK
jgi:hypothetical protein